MDADVKTEGSDRRLSDLVAVTVVILSVFMAVSNIKDDNINQAMQKAKSESVDAWAEYQSARVKLHIDENGLAQLRLPSRNTRRARKRPAPRRKGWRRSTTGSTSTTTSSTCRWHFRR